MTHNYCKSRILCHFTVDIHSWKQHKVSSFYNVVPCHAWGFIWAIAGEVWAISVYFSCCEHQEISILGPILLLLFTYSTVKQENIAFPNFWHLILSSLSLYYFMILYCFYVLGTLLFLLWRGNNSIWSWFISPPVSQSHQFVLLFHQKTSISSLK